VILIHVVLEALPGCREPMAALMRSTMATSQGETGCMVYSFGADLNALDRFVLTELWASEAELDDHLRGSAFAAFRAALPQCGNVVSSTSWAGALTQHGLKRPQESVRP
jgi:quinol monooxygenase YgiN